MWWVLRRVCAYGLSTQVAVALVNSSAGLPAHLPAVHWQLFHSQQLCLGWVLVHLHICFIGGVAVSARSWYYLVARAGFQWCFISLYVCFSVDLTGIHACFACKWAFLYVVGIGRLISQSVFCVASPRGPPGAPSVLSVTLAVEVWVCSQNQNEKLHTFTWKTCSIHGLRT